MHHTLHLYSSLIAVDSSRFRKTIGKFVVLPWYMPEPNLRDLSLVCSQRTFVWQLTVKLFASCFVTTLSRARNRSRFTGLVPLDVRQSLLYELG
jgi:hypothetical protein